MLVEGRASILEDWVFPILGADAAAGGFVAATDLGALEWSFSLGVVVDGLVDFVDEEVLALGFEDDADDAGADLAEGFAIGCCFTPDFPFPLTTTSAFCLLEEGFPDPEGPSSTSSLALRFTGLEGGSALIFAWSFFQLDESSGAMLAVNVCGV